MQNTIYEYESISNEELKNHIINTTELHKYFTLDWKDLKTKQYCGILNFNDQDFHILPKIANAVAGKIPILFDGGIRRGTDVVKANRTVKQIHLKHLLRYVTHLNPRDFWSP